MKVLFLTQTGDLGPASRYRAYMLVPWLEQMGFEVEVSPGIDNPHYQEIYGEGGSKWKKAEAYQIARQIRLHDLERLDDFDVVFVQKGLLPGRSRIEQDFARRKPLVYDFDDAIWLPRVDGDPVLRMLHREDLVKRVIRSATAVVVGNEYLAEYARNCNSNVNVVPSSIDIERYQLAPSHQQQEIRIGWIGSRSTMPYLRPLAMVFRQLGITPRVIAAGDPATIGYPVDFTHWDRNTEVEELNQLDIGIAPLPDTPWEQGKCGTKVLQYMACGKPVVTSPVGSNAMLVRDGVNGFHARTIAEWRDRLRRLINDPGLRARMGAEGRAMVEAEFTAEQAAAKLATVLVSAVEQASEQAAEMSPEEAGTADALPADNQTAG